MCLDGETDLQVTLTAVLWVLDWHLYQRPSSTSHRKVAWQKTIFLQYLTMATVVKSTEDTYRGHAENINKHEFNPFM